MQYSRVSPITARLTRLSTTTTAAKNLALRQVSQVRNLHVQVPAALYTVGSERLRY